MRAKIILLLFTMLGPVRAAEWKSDIFHFSVMLPDSTGWQPIDPPPLPGITVVVALRNPVRNTLFGINVVERVPSANVADPAVQKIIEDQLRQCPYQFQGRSTVKISGIDWLQYPVRAGTGAQSVSGIVRFGAANGYIFAITLLKGGGGEVVQDFELQQAAASFRPLAFAPPVATLQAVPTPPAPATAPPLTPVASVLPNKAAPGKPTPATAAPADPESPYLKWIWLGGGGLVVLLILFKIIGGSDTKQKPRTNYVNPRKG